MFASVFRSFAHHAKTHPEILPVVSFMLFSPAMALLMIDHTFSAPDVMPSKAIRSSGSTWDNEHASHYHHAAYDIRPGQRGWGPNSVFDEAK
jgi:hypothetical protein